MSLLTTFYYVSCILLIVAAISLAYSFRVASRNPLLQIAGPPTRGWFSNNIQGVLNPQVSPRMHDLYKGRYGHTIRLRGLGPLEERLLTLDPLSVSHVLKNSTIYQKPWQSRHLIISLIGCGMLAAEDQVHKRQRRVATPAFSVQNMRALVPLVFRKGYQLKDRWMQMLNQEEQDKNGAENTRVRLDVCHWVSRATFDVIGIAGFDYNFNAIQDETNELFIAYKEMFEVAVSQSHPFRTVIGIYLPFVYKIFPDRIERTVSRCRGVIQRVAGRLIKEKKKKIAEGEKEGNSYAGRDLLSLLLKSNVATDLPPQQRISDDDILNNINTFMFAGSDTTSLSLTWALLLLAQNPTIQSRLRDDLLALSSVSMSSPSGLTEDEIQSLFTTISDLPYLNNVIRETIRLIPPLHSTIRVATQDDVIPTFYPVHSADGKIDNDRKSLEVPKNTLVHIAIEGFNLSKEVWGQDAWEFVPDRWEHLPDIVKEQPGLFANTLTFSAGPRSCIGLRFSMIELKTFLYILLINFVFTPTEDKIIKHNAILTRPYVVKKFHEGSQCPLFVSRYIPDKK